MSHTWLAAKNILRPEGRRTSHLKKEKKRKKLTFTPIPQIWHFKRMVSNLDEYQSWLWGFKTIPVKTSLFARDGKLESPGLGDGSQYYFNEQWASMMVSANPSEHLNPNILGPYCAMLSQSTTVLLARANTPNTSLDPWSSLPIVSRFAECLTCVNSMVPISDSEYAHFASNPGPSTCPGQSRHSIIRWTTSQLPLLHLVKMYSLELILGCGTKCNRTQSWH